MVETKLGGQGNSSQNRLWIFDLITVTSFNLWSESRIQFLSKFFVNMPWECSLDLILDSENCHRWPPSRTLLTFAGRCPPCVPIPVLQLTTQCRTYLHSSVRNHISLDYSVCASILLKCYCLLPHYIILKIFWNQSRTDRRIETAGLFYF